ncbi:hypothetical protein Nepgr_004244 [Nepenthes gracilis]|uniref:At1g68980-like TPR repeats domain-containing protein n=1 Tax=Nepenthes gracilis TaxID=150966 RepID=A0AAD3S0Z5_NEPGR|nr:hypothetical protein Nepgr_004244 [Nepenthes gracilis]
MLSIRKLKCQAVGAMPFTLSSLLACSHCNIFQVPGNLSQRSICDCIVSRWDNINALSTVLGCQYHFILRMHSFSTMAGTILVHARDPAKVSEEIRIAIEEHRYDEAWKLYEQHMQMEGFPRKSVVKRLLTNYAESLNFDLLEKAYGLVEQAFEEGKQTLFEKETLIYLSLALARCGLPVPASILLRKLVGMEEYPPVTAWSAILAHMSQSAPGAYLAAELILEIGYLFQDNRVDPRKKINAPLIAMKPDTLAFSIALAGCLLFGTTRKAEQLLDMMPRIGVRTDSTLLIIMAHIYERNGRGEELKKLKRHIDEAYNLTDAQFRQYYNCLLACHLKFGDLSSASQMVLEMLKKAKEAQNSLATAKLLFEPVENENAVDSGQVSENAVSEDLEKVGNTTSHFICFEDFSQDRKFTRLEIEAREILASLLNKLQKQVEMVTTERGILQPTERTYVKLAKAFLEAGKIKDLTEFLIKAEKEDSPASADDSALVHVINSCISLGWLDRAHDLLDELRFAGIIPSSTLYSSLLKEYCKEKRTPEITSLLRDVRKAGIQLDSSCYDALIQSRVLQKDTQGALHLFKEMKEAKISRANHREFEMLVKGCTESGEAGLMAKLLQEIKEGQREDCGVHDWNNVIHFFCKKRLMQDAEKALKKMRSLGHCPNAQTYHSLVTGYAAVGGKYIEVTELWGEMKALSSSTPLKFDQELLDSVLYTFVRGGFFLRANEVVEMMERGRMFIDKYKYRTLFLKYHKNLYKGKAPKFETESQEKRREAVLRFKKWVGLY